MVSQSLPRVCDTVRALEVQEIPKKDSRPSILQDGRRFYKLNSKVYQYQENSIDAIRIND